MSTDVGAVAVALVSIAGTLGATALTQYFVTRGRRLDAKIQQAARVEERRALADAERRAMYAELNDAARAYRRRGHDYLIDQLDGRPQNLDELEEARKSYGKVYARAQMVLPDGVFKVAKAVNDCLGLSYRAVHEINNGSDRTAQFENLHQWYDGPLLDAVNLLRAVLREDLGVTETGTDIDADLQSLQEAQRAKWPH